MAQPALEWGSAVTLTFNTEFNVVCNAPIDWIVLSKKQLEIIDKLLIYPLDQVAKSRLLDLKKINRRYFKGLFYYSFSLEQRLAFDLVKFQEIQEHFNAFPSYLEAHIGEVLSKCLANLDAHVINGEVIQMPTPNQSASYTIRTFKMKGDSGDELPYMTLESDKGPSWLVIRGTNPNIIGKSNTDEVKKSASQGILADFIDPKGILNIPIDKTLADFIKVIDKLPKPVHFAGHSLGGEYVQHLAVKLKHEKGLVYAYNAPGVPKETKQLYLRLENKPDIINFDKVGDIVPIAGLFLIGKHYSVDQYESNARFDWAHRECDFHKPYTIQKIDIEKEEKKLTRTSAEWIRSHIIGKYCHLFSK